MIFSAGKCSLPVVIRGRLHGGFNPTVKVQLAQHTSKTLILIIIIIMVNFLLDYNTSVLFALRLYAWLNIPEMSSSRIAPVSR